MPPNTLITGGTFRVSFSCGLYKWFSWLLLLITSHLGHVFGHSKSIIAFLTWCYNRVVHSWHFWSIFQSFFYHFPSHFVSIFLKIETENERKINTKWNPNFTFAKIDLKNDHFSSFWQCAWRENSIFLKFPS